MYLTICSTKQCFFSCLVSSFLEGRTGAQCMHRYNKSLDPTVKRGKWDEEEDEVSNNMGDSIQCVVSAIYRVQSTHKHIRSMFMCTLISVYY